MELSKAEVGFFGALLLICCASAFLLGLLIHPASRTDYVRIEFESKLAMNRVALAIQDHSGRCVAGSAMERANGVTRYTLSNCPIIGLECPLEPQQRVGRCNPTFMAYLDAEKGLERAMDRVDQVMSQPW